MSSIELKNVEGGAAGTVELSSDVMRPAYKTIYKVKEYTPIDERVNI